MFKVFSLVFAGLLVTSLEAGATTAPVQLKDYLKEFKSHPKKIMNAELPRRDAQGKVVTKKESIFSGEELKDHRYVTIKNKQRKKFPTDPSHITDNDLPENLVESSNLVYDLYTMDAQGLNKGQAAFMPWSETYWPMYDGVLGQRYADPNYPDSDNWSANLNYVQSYNAASIFNNGSDSDVDNLSPAEKYDLLVGDSGFTMTHANWDLGGQFADRNGYIATWMGICEGWSAAAIKMAEAVRSINVASPTGRSIQFDPSDIRGLASLLWSKASPQVFFIGTRCNRANPPEDGNGRISDQTCFDSNPGSWHVSVVNQLGVLHRPFIMDASYDYQVWNQPVYSYSYVYFNPQTQQQFDNAKDAAVSVAQFTNDKFRSYRSSQTVSVVGVSMDVTYIVEAYPSHGGGSRAIPRTINYVYDLELNGSGRIIGGEWYTNQHPDFLWNPPVASQALSSADGSINWGTWDGQSALPADWRSAARSASGNTQPLAAIVSKLIELSH